MLTYKSLNQKLREAVLTRDNHKCTLGLFCKPGNSKLEVHHSDGDRANNDKSNLVTVCPDCHRYLDKERRARSGFPVAKPKTVMVTCRFCGVEYFFASHKGVKFCSKACYGNYQRGLSELLKPIRLERTNALARQKYHNDIVYKARFKIAQKKQQDRLKLEREQDPVKREEHKRKNLEAVRRCREKKRQARNETESLAA